MADAWGGSWGATSAWGVSWGAGVTPPVAEAATGQGGGPGWNLFQDLPKRKRKVDTLLENVERGVNRALGVEEPTEPIVEEIREEVAELIAEAQPFPDLAPMLAALESVQRAEMALQGYLERLNAIFEEQRAREVDDMEAFMLMARLA